MPDIAVVMLEGELGQETLDLIHKQKPWWIVNARTEEFIAGAYTEEAAKSSASGLNRAAHSAGTDERYRAMEHPSVA